MSKESKFNPAGMQPQKLKKKKRKGRDSRPFLVSTKKSIENSRTLRFAPRTAANIYSLLFFSLFLVLVVLSVISFFRVDRLAELAMKKQVNETELVATVHQQLAQTDQLKYEGEEFVKQLFTIEATDKGKEEWEKIITPKLAQGLNPKELGFSNTNENRSVNQVQFIKLEILSEEESVYRLFYDVTYLEKEVQRNLQIILPVSYDNQSFQLLETPQIIRLSESDESIPYNSNQFSLKGKPVNEEEQEALYQFTQRFFQLYVANDEQLSLISSVEGIGQGTLEQVEIKEIVKGEQDSYHLQGIFRFHFEEEASLTSRFRLDIRANEEGFYVLSINEQE
ncbi:conjugal transfer protein [Enterococcus faecium]|uniref:conjugal transfer protein n=1 Tax=Enterococcus faecium TaxID=1352 RepID=UPI00338D9B80